jgi:predicted NBD/HSP70 family sugar kinase
MLISCIALLIGIELPVMQNDDLEFLNCRNMLHAIEHDLATPSRAQVAQHLGLSRTATSMLAQKLLKAGLITELESLKRGRGRPGTPLTLDEQVWHALGAAFYSGAWNFLIINLVGKIVESKRIAVNSTDQHEVIEALITGLIEIQRSTSHTLLPGYGIGAPGLVDNLTGSIYRADDLGWKEIIPLKQIIEGRTGKQALVINRYRANGLAEIRFGNHSGKHNVIYLGIGTGIAGSIYLDQELMNSTNYRIGHMVIDPHGPLCGCGQRGCLQAMAGEGALLSFVHHRKAEQPTYLAELTDDHLTGAAIAALAEEGNEDAREALRHIAEPIAIAVSTLANAIAPDEVIIGGPLGDLSSYLVDRVRAKVYERILDWQAKHLTILKGTQGHYGPAIGAATYVLNNKMELIFGQGCSER